MNSITNLMVEVSKLYYHYGLSQKDIAFKLGISRGYVSQLMDRARNTGIVQIIINDPSDEETDLERYAGELFELDKAIVVSTPDLADRKFLNHELIAETCRYVDSIMMSNMTVAFSWGSTIYQISTHMVRHPDIQNVVAIPLCGGTSNLEKKIYVSEISSNITEAYSGMPLHIPLPAIVQNADIKKYIYSDANISGILAKMDSADIALFTVGGFGAENVLYRGGYIDDVSLRASTTGMPSETCARILSTSSAKYATGSSTSGRYR